MYKAVTELELQNYHSNHNFSGDSKAGTCCDKVATFWQHLQPFEITQHYVKSKPTLHSKVNMHAVTERTRCGIQAPDIRESKNETNKVLSVGLVEHQCL